MITQNQPILLSAGLQRSGWIRPALASLLAVGMFFNWGIRLSANAQGDSPADQSPAMIIDNELQMLGITGGTISSRFASATASQLQTALVAAIDEFPAPNPVNLGDNPGYVPYTPEDLTNYILITATNNFGVSNNYKSMAANLVKAAVTELQLTNKSFANISTDGVIEKLTAGAAAILANRLPGDYVPSGGQTPTQIAGAKDSLVSSNIDTLIANSVKLDPSDANGILQEIVNEIKTPPMIPSGPTISGTTTVTGTNSLSQLQAVNAVATTFKAVPVVNLVTTASAAISSVGSFFASTSGTFSANQSFIVAMIKSYSNAAVPTLAQVEMQAGEAVASGGPITTATGAAGYVAPIINGVSSSAIAGVAEAAASYITGVVNQSLFAALVTTGTGGGSPTLGSSKATAAVDGAVLGGVIALNPTSASTYLSDSGIYGTIDSSHSLGTSGNRINFVAAALGPIASSTAAVNVVLNNTILSGTSFVNEKASSFVGDFNSLTAATTKAVLGSPASEAVIVNSLYGYIPTASTPVTTFAAIATKSAGVAGSVALKAVLDNTLNLTTDGSKISFSGTVAFASSGTAGVNDATRSQIAIGLINDISSSNYTSALQTIAGTIQATTDSNKAAFLAPVVNAFVGSNSTVNTLLNAAFANTGGGSFGSGATGAGALAKLLPLTVTTNIAQNAAQNAGSTSTATSAGFLNDESIANAILAVSTVKANTTLAASVVQTIAHQITDTSASDFATFAAAVVGSNLSSQTKVISQGVADAMQAGGQLDSSLESYASALATDLAGKNPDQIAGGVAQALNSASQSGSLATTVTLAASQALASGSTPSASIRAKIGAAVAFSQPSQAGSIVTDMINGNGQLSPLSSLGDKTSVATAVTVQAPASAGSVAQAVAAFLSTDNTGFADIGSVAGAVSKSIPLTVPLNIRSGYIATVVADTVGATVNGQTIISNSNNMILYLSKAASGAAATGGDLISKAVAGQLGYTNTSSALYAFTAAVGAKAGGSTVYIAEGFAENLPGNQQLNFALGAATASGTTSAAAAIKATVAQGVAMADTSQAASIASGVAATIQDHFVPPASPNAAQAKIEIANNGLRQAIAVAVAKGVPGAALDVAYNVGLQLDNAGPTDVSFASFGKAIASAVSGMLPKANLADQLGAIASELLLAAHQNVNTLSNGQLQNLIFAIATVKSGMAYDVVGASIATVATWMSGANLTAFETGVEGMFTNTSTNPVKTQATNAVGAYTAGTDAFDVGPVTMPETGVTNA